ncbi:MULTISPECIES: TolC family outer membrane protein [Rahnella]|jgi:adhesin transport system outer membrane protein|uniref:TolC family outer membrane protein n=1 Tax=Rahnella victoriana TaxID=1510570 RepID=A0ABS0DRK8_9GAMM|nr:MULTISPECIES: TolC family outer membrane protein [Rahnella]MBF7956522.1 TolC family outer membrane protein [Rahnella victoriana]TBX36323.1 type I secretion system outer membrane protein [Rahnella victoriana]TDS95972.1 adhesin transport system outer membrane protein [Rahnella sp. BIGb0236]VTQ59987.1 long-chain-fatty-acid--CoA ligase [Campylobacter jejuni]
MKNKRVMRSLTVILGTLCLTGLTGNTGVMAAVKQPEFNWQAAPTEEMRASLTLQDAILRAFARNPQISEAAAQIRVGKGNLDEAKSAWYPQISLQGTAGKSHQTDSAGSLSNNASAGVQLSQLLYDFGRTGGSISQQEYLSDSYRYSLYSTMTDVALSTMQAYLSVKRYQALSLAARDNIASLERVRDTAKLRADAGLSSQSDVLQAETRIAGMKATVEQYRAQQRSAQAQLTVLTGVVSDNLPDLPQSLLDQKVTLDKIPYESSTLVRAAQAKQQAAIEEVNQNEAQHWPTLKVQAGRTRYENSGGGGSYWDDQVQLAVDAPVYQGGAVSARVRAAEGQRQAAQAEVEKAKLDINQKASTAYADMIGGQQRQLAGEQQFGSATHTRSVYQDEYKLSKRSLNDLLSVEQDVFQADTSRIGALYDGWDATVRYAAAVDNLVDMLGIDRQKQTGDTIPSL